ncbi:MAG: hydantoinase/oxoprolinase family protein [Gammaproteobacteria bacterium]|nr:hydantoinase/oxoprolinase family protein [Gammaproteobacteria bacterium]
MSWTIGVDVGGTFTDFYAYNSDTGEVKLNKRPSTRGNPGEAVLAGVDDLEQAGLNIGSLTRLAHGTTVATNALIQRRGGRVALLTTKGFRDLLEIGRQVRPHMYDLYKDYPAPLIDRTLRFEVDERITAGGRVITPLSESVIDAALQTIAQANVDAVAVCFLFAFANADHEKRVGDALRKAFPNLSISLSSEVQSEFREYERFSTTVLNAYLQSVMDQYIGSLEAGVSARAPAARLGINQSSGGLMSATRTRAFPVRTALSGPAAGVIGALARAREAGRADVITLDMGGTSADVALIQNHRADITFDRDVAGFPVRLPAVDVHTVGAGGGSIAWFDRDGLLKVGPQSAGAEPGPACYGRGGTEPTVTDANLVLGRLSDKGLLDGRMPLNADLSRAAFDDAAKRLGYEIAHAAHGMLGIVVANMVRAIRTISVERGHDPRDFVLMPFGGAGPLHARDVAAALGIREILVAPAPGIVCAEGLVVADQTESFVTGTRLIESEDAFETFREQVRSLTQQAQTWYEAEDIEPKRRGHELSVDARYVGQNFELRVPISQGGILDPTEIGTLETLRASFFAVHDQAYGYHNPHDAIELINIRLTAIGSAPDTIAPPASTGDAAQVPDPIGAREVWFEFDAPVSAPIYSRSSLAPGHKLVGPAVIEQLDTTTLLYPGDTLQVDAQLNLLIEVTP